VPYLSGAEYITGIIFLEKEKKAVRLKKNSKACKTV